MLVDLRTIDCCNSPLRIDELFFLHVRIAGWQPSALRRAAATVLSGLLRYPLIVVSVQV